MKPGDDAGKPAPSAGPQVGEEGQPLLRASTVPAEDEEEECDQVHDADGQQGAHPRSRPDPEGLDDLVDRLGVGAGPCGLVIISQQVSIALQSLLVSGLPVPDLLRDQKGYPARC